MIRKPIDKVGKTVIKMMDSTVDFAVLVVFLLLFCYGCYGVWDSQQVYKSANTEYYQKYKPTVDNTVYFDEIKVLNPDVLGWLTVYGTKIDYPLVQGEDNDKYLSTDAEGKYATAGSIFLDYQSQRDFSEFNTLVHGHDMASGDMFGDLKKFKEKDFFDTHKYGNLYYDNQEYQIEFFAFLAVDGYNQDVYNLDLKTDEEKLQYINLIYSHALHSREIPLSETDRIIILSTCTFDFTNGRHLLVGKITEEFSEDNINKNKIEEELVPVTKFSYEMKILGNKRYKVVFVPIVLILLLVLILFYIYRRIKMKK